MNLLIIYFIHKVPLSRGNRSEYNFGKIKNWKIGEMQCKSKRGALNTLLPIYISRLMYFCIILSNYYNIPVYHLGFSGVLL